MKTSSFLLPLVASAFVLAAEPPLDTRPPSPVTGEGGGAAALDWRLPPHATLDGNTLTIDVPEVAARQGCRVEADIDLSPYDGMPVEAEIEAWGENIGKPRDAWNGLKFQFEIVDPESGEKRYPNTASLTGDFDRRMLRLRDSICSTRPAPSRLVLGFQDTYGKVVFDLSTLRIHEGKPYWPITNQTHRCEYSGALGDRALPVGADLRAVRNFRGVMSPGRDMTEDDFRTLADWGATLLRYQMCRDWGKTGTNRDIAEFEAWLDSRLDHFEAVVLPMCRKHGLKAVLDMHVTPGGRIAQGEFAMFFEREYADWFVDKWRRIAERFCGNADVLYGYDLCNEPVQVREALSGCDWWSLQRRAAEAIREVDSVTPVIIESNAWDTPGTYGAMSPLALVNVIYEVHVYNPVEYTHQGIHRPVDAPLPYPSPAKGWDKERLRRVLAPVRSFEERHGAKIYVGEFSAAAWAPGAENYLRDCIEVFNEYGWDWTYHAFRESPCWDVEKEGPDFPHLVPAPDTPRKLVLLEGLAR